MIIMKSSNKNKGWCEDQDKIIGELVERLGPKAWAQIAEQLNTVHNYPKRSGKQCRQRWHNHLDPKICKNSWTRIEQDILFEEHRKYGNKWTLISARLPGRTDNSIKNHFYSTVRKSLRRISKFLGSKNSTFKMRQIKPSTLSQIFSLAEQKPEQLSKDSKYNNQMKNCKEIAQYLMNFARCKLSDRRYVMDSQEKKSFLNILDQMMIINNLYENKKIVEAKMKKEKLLERNFDDAASSGSQQDSSENSQNCALRHQTAETEQKINGFELVTTRSKRKVRPPVHFQSESPKKQKQKQTNLAEKKLHQFVQYQEQPQIKEQENEHVIMKRLLSPMIQNNEEQYEEIPETYSRKNNENEQNNSDYFFIELPENTEYENKGFYQFYNSPGFKNTPHPLSPPAIHSEFLKESCQQPIKVEECDLVMNQIMEKVQKNSNLSVETLQRPVFMPSPSSAFRQCF